MRAGQQEAVTFDAPNSSRAPSAIQNMASLRSAYNLQVLGKHGSKNDIGGDILTFR